MKLTAALRNRRIKARAARKAALSPIKSGMAGRFTASRAERHKGLDLIALDKRRAKNKVARRSRRINRLASKK
jgi:hypothetical protein